MELEQSSFDFKPVADRRPHVPEPLPVRLIAVADMRIESAAGLERELDGFYVNLLGMQRVPPSGDEIVYRAENFDLYVDVLEPPVVRDDFRPIGIEVRSLPEMQLRFIEAEVEHTRRKGLVPGREALVLQDPAGNWIEVTESRAVG